MSTLLEAATDVDVPMANGAGSDIVYYSIVLVNGGFIAAVAVRRE